MENQPTVEQTTVSETQLDLNDWLGAPGADNILTPAEEKKPGFFSTEPSDIDLDDNSTENVPQETSEELKQILDQDINSDEEEETEEPTTSKGRPKTEKSALVNFLKKRIEADEMFTFDDYDESKQSLDEYLGSLSEKDVEELWQANIDQIKNEVASKTPQEFFESLPQELQYAATHWANGGDIKSILQALTKVQEVRELSVEEETGQEQIIRQYLSATQFGTQEEIDEEIQTWKDLGTLKKKAEQFKPKLDQMHDDIVKSEIEEQELLKKQQEEAANKYIESVYNALKPGEINGLKLDKRIQEDLYLGLIKPQYPSISGRPTNKLGHLLEKYQFVEPNYPLVAEALWLLSDPDAYRKNLVQQGKNQATEDTVRKLKTEQASRNSTATQTETDNTSRQRKISRNPGSIFKR